MEIPVRRRGESYAVEGVVQCKCTGYEMTKTKFGDRLRIWFTDGKGDFSVYVNPVLSEKSKLWGIVTAMGFSPVPGEMFNLDQILNKEVTLVLAKNQNGFVRLIQALPPKEVEF